MKEYLLGTLNISNCIRIITFPQLDCVYIYVCIYIYMYQSICIYVYIRSLFIFSLLWKHFVRQQPLVSQSYNGRFTKEILYHNNSNNSIFEATVNTITENWGTSGKIVISSIHDYSKIYILFSVALTTGNQLCPHGLSTIGDERLRSQWKM